MAARVVPIWLRRGIAGIDAIINSQPFQGTELWKAIYEVLSEHKRAQRLVVVTDEQAGDSPMQNVAISMPPRCYMVNVGTYKNGVAYPSGGDRWLRIDGFSESVFKWIAAVEADLDAQEADE